MLSKLSITKIKGSNVVKVINASIILAFSMLIVLYSALLQTKPGEAFQLHYDAPIWVALQCFVAQLCTLKWHQFFTCKRHAFNTITKRYIAVFTVSNLSFTFLFGGILILIEAMIGIQELSVNRSAVLFGMNILLHTAVGGFTLGYKLLMEVKKQQLSLQETKQSLLESQVKTLQQHIDPHFLFNNLNVLSALIQTDPDEADEYLSTFSEIYRYILQHKHESVVSLAQELQFVEDYMTLINTRFDGAYQLKLESSVSSYNQLSIVPCAIQLAIENAIKHNEGNREVPLSIQVEIDEKHVIITNQLVAKAFKPESTQLGLKHLNTQYKALFEQSIKIEQLDTHFRLTLPLIKTNEQYK